MKNLLAAALLVTSGLTIALPAHAQTCPQGQVVQPNGTCSVDVGVRAEGPVPSQPGAEDESPESGIVVQPPAGTPNVEGTASNPNAGQTEDKDGILGN